jgi:hypothetical protein
LSFSLYYKASSKKGFNTLDLTCKDEYEFDFIVSAIKALLFLQRGKNISKDELLRHSRVYRKYSEANVPSQGIEKMLNFSVEYLEK